MMIVALWGFSAFADTQMVEMRDGVSLATEVWVPSGTGPFPTILRRTPYGRGLDATAVSTLNTLGYAVVSQDVRGIGGSDGEYRAFFDDAHDGYDTIEWIAAQSWSNQKVGGWGNSAEGITELLAAGEAPEALKCIQIGVSTGDMYEALFPGGVWRTELTSRWLEELGQSQFESDLRAHEVDSDYWDAVRLDDAEIARIDIPMLYVTGFYDIFDNGPLTHTRLRNNSPGGADQWMLLGPWTHGGALGSEQGEIAYPADSAYTNYVPELVGFFDYCLKDGPRPDYPGVKYYVSTFDESGATATGEWRTTDLWPPASTSERLVVHGDALVGESAPNTAESVRLPVDPADPVPSIGGGNLTTAAGPYDQTTVDSRSDVYVISTPPVEAAVEIIGQATAQIWAASDTTDIDVIVRVEVVTQDGHSWLIADGSRRGKFIGGMDEALPLTPGEFVPFDIDLGPIGVKLAPGQSLRLAISPTLSPRFEPNPGVFAALDEDVAPVATALTVTSDASHESWVKLPIASGTLGGFVNEDEGDSDTDSDKKCGCDATSGGTAGLWLLGVGALLVRRRR